MRNGNFSQENKEFIELLSQYNSIFQHGFVPQRDMILELKNRQECFELMKKSCEDGFDYVAVHYDINVEHMKKKVDVIYD